MLWIWLCVVMFLIFIEVVTINLVTIWYIASGIIAMILSIFIDSFFVQFLVFVILGTILLVTTREYLIKLIGSKGEKTNLDRVIGMTGIVTEEIRKNKPGEIKVDGKRWTAVSDKKILVDSEVKVLSIDGVKLKVEEVED